MHILVVNDDGPPSNQASPYVHSLVSTLQEAGHTVSVILPHVQRSWIGKAHIVDQTLTPTYFRPGTLLQDDGVVSSQPFNDGKEEWILMDGTPASCVQIGLHHEFKERGPVDLVLSGPNFGRNTTAIFALSSGTIGGALEGAVCGKKAIALSYAFDSREHDADVLAEAATLSMRLAEKLVAEWPEDVHLYSINVPVRKGVSQAKIVYTEMLQNQWKHGSSFEEIVAGDDPKLDPGVHERQIQEGLTTPSSMQDANGTLGRPAVNGQTKQYQWAPNFADIRDAVRNAGSGDGWTVLQGMVSVTPLRANFWHLPDYKGEIKLPSDCTSNAIPASGRATQPPPTFYACVDYPDRYVQPLILQALSSQFPELSYELVSSLEQLPSPSSPILQFRGYESLDFDHAWQHPTTSLISAYVIRKALVRKHYLSNTISTWLVKRPQSLLHSHFKAAVHFELDYAEFLDEALVDAWDLNESLARNKSQEAPHGKEWWILKPGMSDGGNGLRLFSSLEELRAIFEEWDADNEEEDDEDVDADADADADAETTEEKGDGDNVNEKDNKLLHKRTSEFSAHGDASETKSGTMTSQLRHFVAQPYIHPPLMLQSKGNRKFHIRVYVVAVGALKVYVFKEMLALFAAKPYQAPIRDMADGSIDLAAHLTNTCFQDKSTRDSSVYRFWELDDILTPGSDWKGSVWEQICAVAGEVIEAAAREQIVHFQTLPNAFEIFGVDFLVDAESTVWLLEVNAFPDFKQTGEGLRDVVVGGLFEEVIKAAVTPFFAPPPSEDRTDTTRMRLVRDVPMGKR